MKKYYFLFLVIFLASCMKNEPSATVTSLEEPPSLTTDEYRAFVALKPRHTISYDEALLQATEASTLFSRESLTKAAPKSILDGLAITNSTMGLTKSDANEADTVLYLFNYANDEGYVFVSADERAPGILAYIEKGNFNIQDSIECPAAAMLFSGMEVLVRQEIERSEFLKDSLGEVATAKYNAITKYDNSLTKGKEGNQGPPPIITYEPRYTKHNPNYGTIVQTNWGQGDPFNGHLPPVSGRDHALVGCDAVVVAQIMAHFDHPQSYNGMPLYTNEVGQYKNWYDFDTPWLLDKIAIFNKFIFDRVIQEYNGNVSTGSYEHDRDFLRAMGYSTPWKTVGYNFGDVKASIDSGWLVFARGDSHRTDRFFGWHYTYSNGHAWIIDHYTNITKTFYEVKTYYNGRVQLRALSSSTTMHMHCNMGWSESKNGYYIDGVFNASVVPEVKTKSETANNYQYRVEIAPRIRIEL